MSLSLKQVKKIVVSHASFDTTARAVREFLRQVTVAQVRDTNPKCEVVHKLQETQPFPPPTVAITYSDGKTSTFVSPKLAIDMLESLRSTSAKLEVA
eukprot:m.23287 g.23287  ORF g.23287 m.23287 type:complete len:97 (-) comp9362_c0_seq1:319-609(-)